MAVGLKLEWHDNNHPWSQEYEDHFYSLNNGREECRHVFINGNNLAERWPQCDQFVIGELGFGTGLNFLETWRQWRELRAPGQQLTFVSFENHMLEPLDFERANLAWPTLQQLSKILLTALSQQDKLQAPLQLDSQTSLQIVIDDALEGVTNWQGFADAWYLDGFSPAKNPAMWSADLMQAVYNHTYDGGSFATYTAAGWVRRNLVSAGFVVERVPGHANKRHISVGYRP